MEAAKGSRAMLMEHSVWFKDGNRLAAWVLALSEVLAWHESVLFTGFTLNRKEDGWQLVVKAVKGNGNGAGKDVVAFSNGTDAYSAFRLFAKMVSSNTVKWFPDQYKQGLTK